MGHYHLPRRARPSLPADAFHAALAGVVDPKVDRVRQQSATYTLIVASVDTVNHVAYCKRPGDTAANNGYPYRYLAGYTPSFNDVVVISPAATGHFILWKLA